ncbi:cell envelope integrity protein CreD [Leptospira yasudae]|uniref:cell envelope integrity protein CreD n=1 Tax=Leptospira yasudae TaxID=2202201 RepID=UPI001090E1CC|nr:cell envelope integrity protein CreD [Leptospira yasudae]TGN00427.1 cell envelope integrity protein CreD [Leptospira yasudae]
MDVKTPLQQILFWFRSSLTIRIIGIGILALLLLIPSFMVSNLIQEREQTRNAAEEEVTSKWGGSQTIGGPIVSVPFYDSIKNERGESERILRYAHFLPEDLQITGTVKPEKRYRGIYIVPLYQAELKISGSFSALDKHSLPISNRDLLWSDAFLSLGISDVKGIREKISIQLGGDTKEMGPGPRINDVFVSGVNVKHSWDPSRSKTFSLKLSFNGSKELYFLPMAKETKVNIDSPWQTPSFEGDFLPDFRDITSSGFKANWKVLELNRNYPQDFIGDAESGQVNGYRFGVRFLLPVDEYHKTIRSSKYSELFLLLTFITYFFIEVYKKVRLHFIQYLLLGFAVLLFYIMLLSLTEHIPFNVSYWISSSLILALVTLYSRAFFKGETVFLVAGGTIFAFYLFFFTLLQLEDFALLVGTFGLFILLAIAMYFTRRIQELESNKDSQS